MGRRTLEQSRFRMPFCLDQRTFIGESHTRTKDGTVRRRDFLCNFDGRLLPMCSCNCTRAEKTGPKQWSDEKNKGDLLS